MSENGTPDMTLRQFIESTWFKAFSRWASILGFGLASAVGGWLLTIDHRITEIEQDRAVKIVEFNQRIGSAINKVDGVGNKVEGVADDVVSVKEDVALVKGILQQMQREQSASWRLPPQLPPQALNDVVSTSTPPILLP